jgi:hypothetical protein
VVPEQVREQPHLDNFAKSRRFGIVRACLRARSHVRGKNFVWGLSLLHDYYFGE